MATTLQRQLTALAAPASSLLQPEQRKKVSIIFTPQEAAKLDKDTIYQIGLEGLAELIVICPDLFEPFRNGILFSETSKNFERAVEDKATNDTVDEAIGKFLITLSPYFMLKASLKCLEWVMYRFHIERFNVDAVIECILPYYDTKHFVMIIQTLQFGSDRKTGNANWQWLATCAQTASLLRKATLHSNASGTFILWLFQTLRKFLLIHQSHPDNLSSYLGFMISTIVGIISKFTRDSYSSGKRSYNFAHKKRKETAVHVILSQIHSLFEEIINLGKYETAGQNREVFAIAYVIITSIGVASEEHPDIATILGSKIKRIFNLLIKNRIPGLLEETYLLMDMVVDHIYFDWAFSQLGPFKKAMGDLAIASQNWDVSNLVSRIMLSNVLNGNMLRPKKLFRYMSEIQLHPKPRSEILSKIYFKYKDGEKKTWVKTLLTRFEIEYPSEFDLARRNDSHFASDITSFLKGKRLEGHVEHPDVNIRASAVRKMIMKATECYMKGRGVSKKKGVKIKAKKNSCAPDSNRTATLLKPRFVDDDEAVLCALLKPSLKKLLQIFSSETLVRECILVIKRKVGVTSTRLALKKICNLAKKKENEKFRKQILSALIPFLFPRKTSHVDTAAEIISSSFAQEDKLLSKYRKLTEMSNQATPEEFCSHSYQVLAKKENYEQLGHLGVVGDTAVDLTIAFLLLTDETELIHLLNLASKIGFRSTAEFPVTAEGCRRSLLVAEKKRTVSIEIILSKVLNMDIGHFSTQLHVIKFVWSLSELENSRRTCMSFLKSFLEQHYPDPLMQFWFWLVCLHKTSSLKEDIQESLSELYLIRCLQFTGNFIKDFGIPATVDVQSLTAGIKNTQERQKPVTRSQGKVGELALTQSVGDKNKQRPTQITKGRNIIREGVSPTWCLLEILLSKCIQHPSPRVRELTMKTFAAVQNVPNLSTDWLDLLNNIMPYETEIIADNCQPSVLVGTVIARGKLVSIQSEIIKTLSCQHTDKEIFMGLVSICQHVGSLMYEDLEPIIKIILESDPDSKQLLALLNCFEISQKSTSLVPRFLEHKGPAKLILKHLSSRKYAQASDGLKKQLFCMMIDSSLCCKLPEVKLCIQRCVRKWEVDASLISEEIKKCLGPARLAATTSRPKGTNQNKDDDANENSDWKGRAEVILEFLQGMKKLTAIKKLLPPLFRILKICVALEEQSPVEYLKQLTLTALTMCCDEEMENEKEKKIDSDAFHVDLVIDCLRCSRNPQTHHHALILLNYAAKRFQEQVLHGVMSLFTFMGNSILRQDDTYSTQLIQQTVTTIIPALTKAGKGGNPQFSRIVVSAGVFRVFASALQDIPVHRRLPVFTSLVETLDPVECLWQVLIIIIDNALNRDRKRSNLNADMELAVDLAWFCGPKVVIKSLADVYEFFISVSRFLKICVSEEDLHAFKNSQSPAEKAVLDLSRKECYRDIQIVIHYTLELMVKIAAKFSELEDDEKLDYHIIMERCLSFSRVVSGLSEDKIFRLIAHRNFEVLEKINAVLEVQDFVRIVAIILERNEVATKRRILDMLNLRLVQKIEWFRDLNILLPLLQPLLKVTRIQLESEDFVTLVQTAFLSLKLIAKHLAFSHPEDFVTLFHQSLEYATHENSLLSASALLCLGELFCLKSLLLPNLNDVTSGILRAFKISLKHLTGTDISIVSSENDDVANQVDANNSLEVSGGRQQQGENSLTTANLLCMSTITCMNKMVEQLGSLMGSKFLKRALIFVLTMDWELSKGDATNPRKKAFDQRLRVLLKSIALKIPVRNSLLPLKEAFSSLTGKPRAAKAIMLILKDALNATVKPDFVLILPSLCDAFKEEFLSYRCNSGNPVTGEMMKVDDKSFVEVVEVEDAVIECFIAGAVLKMSEGAFRPYYHKLSDWARGNETRLITFYRFSAAAAERLKSLFVNFTGNIMSEAVTALNQNKEMTKAILLLFYHVFSNDREGFVTTDRFNTLVKPLVELVESDYILRNQIELKILTDTLIQLAMASNDLNRWQHLIDLISIKAHHSSKQVRLNVVSIVGAAASELGKDFLPLLPPVVPFLAELMNDDDSEVESATQKMLLQLENIVGEPLQPYFT